MSTITNAQACAAFVKAQRAFGPALKTHTNPAFRSKYADLGAVVEAVIDALGSAGLALMQITHEQTGGVCVETVFVHESGETLSGGRFAVPAAKNDPQGYGSALTYARRYSLMSACGVAPEDDDGNAASQPRQRTTAPAPTAAPTPADWPARIEAAHATGGEPWAKACAWYAGLSAESQQALQSRLAPAVAAALGAAS